jgi:hypothetical protein
MFPLDTSRICPSIPQLGEGIRVGTWESQWIDHYET